MKILASDYDGTLRTEEYVSKEDIDAIKKFQNVGNLFGIVTGRSMESLKNEIARNGFTYDFIVTNNGGVIYDKDQNLLQCNYMDFDKALHIIEYIKTIDCVSYVINDGFHRYKYTVDQQQVDRKYGNVEDTNVLQEEIFNKRKIAQLVISLNDSQLAHEISDYINRNYKGYAVAYINVNCVDIVPEGVSKAEGLTYIENYLHLQHEDIYTIGDSFNDLPMLHAFNGCTVKNAKDIIQKEIGIVYESVADCIENLLK